LGEYSHVPSVEDRTTATASIRMSPEDVAVDLMPLMVKLVRVRAVVVAAFAGRVSSARMVMLSGY
jgi:hypothetical protein